MLTPALFPASGGPCEYPCRPPSFDPTHPMAQGISPGRGISVVATPSGGAISLITAAPATRTGTLTSKMDPSIGQSIVGAATGNYLTFPGQISETQSVATLAMMITITSAGSGQFPWGTDSTGAGFFLATGPAFFAVNFVLTITSIIPWVQNGSYFFASSGRRVAGGTTINFVVRNLKTGIIQTDVQTAAGGTAPSSNGTYQLGQRGGGNNMIGRCSAAMYAPFYATLPQLYNWALDPWAFWCPYTVLDTLQASIKGPRVQDTAVTGYDSPIYRPQWDQTTWGWNP